jgi:hypothetical protein
MRVTVLGGREGLSEESGARSPQCRRPLHVARRERRPDEWNPPVPVYGPYGLGSPNDFDVITDA